MNGVTDKKFATSPPAISVTVSTGSYFPNGVKSFVSSAFAKPTDVRKDDMPKLKPTHISPTDQEEEAINAAIAEDPDDSELDDEWFAHALPAADVVPHVVERWRRTRGKQRTPTKESVSIRLDADVLAYYRGTGRGWQSRINAALRQAVFESSDQHP